MDGIEHQTIFTNGINLHVASIGNPAGPAILFLHGFPELWYSWRHQLLFFSDLGFRAIAPDLRGYGDSDSPICRYSYTFHHIVGDLIGLLDHFAINKVFLVGHDLGAAIAWAFALFRPDRIKALVALSVPFQARDPAKSSLEFLRDQFGSDYYVCKFADMEAAKLEEEFASIETENLFKVLFSIQDPRPLCIPKDTGLRGFPVPDSLPSWLCEEDITYYASKFNKKGFNGPLNYFRAIALNWELTAPWTGAKVDVPTKFITGRMDSTYHIPGVIGYIYRGGFKSDVRMLQEVVEIQGAAHFVNQEKAEEINKHIHDFIKKFSAIPQNLMCLIHS